MSKPRCKAKNPSNCRFHGTGSFANKIDNLNTFLDNKNIIKVSDKEISDFINSPKTINNDFIKAEDHIRQLFPTGANFEHNGEQLIVEGTYKPQTSGGEPKTDIYVQARNEAGDLREIKISYKKTNAEFLENKANSDRAKMVLGEQYKETISNIASDLKVGERTLYNGNKNSYVLGYRLDIMNGAATGYAPVELPQDQLVDVYSGHNLPEAKRHAKIDGRTVQNSGVADYIIVGDNFKTTQEVVNNMQPIKEYVKQHPKVYVALKAVNYFPDTDKWDGNRPLALHVDWNKNSDGVMEGRINEKIVYETTCNPIVDNLRKIL